MQRIVTGIGRTHPRPVLDALTWHAADTPAVDEVDGLPAALAGHDTVLADWLRNLLLAGRDNEPRIARLLPLALDESLTDGAATAVADVAASADPDEFLRLVRMLRHCGGFTVAHPDLVMALVTQSEAQLDGDALEEVKRRLVVAAIPNGAGWSGAAADETLIARRDRALLLGQDMTLSESARAIFNQAAAAIQHVIDFAAGRDSED